MEPQDFEDLSQTIKSYPLVASAVFNEPWMIQPEMLAIICEVIGNRVNGVMTDEPSWRASAAAFERLRMPTASTAVEAWPCCRCLG